MGGASPPPLLLRALAARAAPPREFVEALAGAVAARQSQVVAALAAAALLRPPPDAGYEARVLGAVAKAVGDELEDGVADALAAALGDRAPPSTSPLPPPTPGCQWRAYYFGAEAAPAPVVASASPDVLAAGTGAAAWPAGAALAGALLARPHLTSGSVVWELGCGCALAGAAVAAVAAARRASPAALVLTDGDRGALANAAVTLAGNGVAFGADPGAAPPPRVALAALDWRHRPPPAWPAPDLVVGADIMYDPGRCATWRGERERAWAGKCADPHGSPSPSATAPALASLLATLLAQPGRDPAKPKPLALLAGVERAAGTAAAHAAAFARAGLTVSRSLPPPTAPPAGPWHASDEGGGVVGWWVLTK